MRRLSITLTLLTALCINAAHAQRGVHGPRTVTAANTIVNEYTALSAPAVVGATTITVANSTLNANGRFTGALQPGDLIMIYQVQGATINGTAVLLSGTTYIANPVDTSWGRITTYNNCGNWEFAEVRAVPNGTSITLDCGLRFDYSTGGTNRTQVIRVPRYTTLTINNGGVLTCDDWNGTTGGVLAVEVDQNTVVNAGGSIDATGRGFRGGNLAGDNVTGFGINNMGSNDPTFGADKGEGIVGYQADYDPIGGRYGRGAAGNAGGGGCAHNGGGGGGANGGSTANWKGMGVPDPNAAYTAAWNLDPLYGLNYIPTLTLANSSGGGKGGYTFSGSNQNATTLGPGNAAWGGDTRDYDACGLGGRPLNYNLGKLFLGGGGGAGDQNQNQGGNGGDGGGLIYIMNYGTISGAGAIVSNGNNGVNSFGTAPFGSYAGRDAGGGGGAGGTIILNSVGAISGVSTAASGGNGGNQAMTTSLISLASVTEAEGPGGGGGGGYIALSNGAITQTANGGNNGTTNSGALTEFPPNGAMRGGSGTTGQTVTNFTIVASGVSICAGNTANLTASTTGTPPGGSNFVWWDALTGGNQVGSGSPFTTPVLGSTTTYYVGLCPGGTYRVPVTVTVTPGPAAPTAGSNSPICQGQTLNLTANTVVGATYSWTGPNSFTSSLEDPSIVGATTAATGTYSVTVTIGGCTSPVGTVAVTVNPGPAAPTAGSNSPICAGQTLNLTSNTVGGATYSWTGPNSFTSSIEDPSIAGATTAATGTYSVTVTVAGCTSAFGTVAVVVNPVPATPTAGSNSPICAGQTLNLTSNTVGGATYSWTGPNSFTSSLEDPSIVGATTAATGTYSVTITQAGCTSAAGTVAVTVNPVPAAPTAGSNSPICQGQTLNLTANTVGGATYSWTGPNSFTSSVEDPSIAGATTAATGTYSVTVTVGGCTSAAGTVAVTVNPGPAAPTAGSNSPICAGQTLNLTSNTVGGATYSWTGPNSFTSSVEDPSIAGATTAATGTYSVTVTVGGCTSAFGTVAVVVNPVPATPTAGSNSPICEGQTLNLTSNTVGGATYSWTGPNSFTSSLEDPSIAGATAAAAGTYSVTITQAGCTSAAGTVAVTVNPVPAAPTAGSNSPICAGQTLNLTSNTVGGATYSWTGPNSFTSSVEDPSISGATTAATGTYSVTVTVAGCTSTFGTVAVVVNPVPATPTAGSNSPICDGQTLNLTSNTVGGATYSWTGPNSFTSSLEDPSITGATTAASGTYSVTITENGCTSAAGTVSVVVNPVPAAPTANSNSPICEGQTLNLDAATVGGATYSWTGPNTFTSSLEDPSIPGATSAAGGTYSVTVTVSGCTSAAGTVSVTINPLPVAQAGTDASVCTGDSVQLNGAGGTGFSWSPATGLSNTGISNPMAGPSATTTYTLTVTDANGCQNTDDVIVTVNNLPVVSAGTDVSICSGDSVQLNGSGAATSQTWSPAAGLGSTTVLNPMASPGATTTYSLTITDANGCQNTDSVIVTVNTLPPVSAGPDQSMCFTGNVLLNASGATSYVWSPATGLSCVNCQSPTANPPSSTTYIVTGTDANGCSSDDTVTVNVSNNLIVSAGADQTICVGDSVQLATAGGVTYAWSPAGSLSNAGSATPMAGPAATTTYTVLVTDGSGCQGSDSVTVFVNPAVAATAAGATTICIGQTASVSAGATGGDGNFTYNWMPGPLTGSPVNVTPVTTTTYTVTATDSNGCQDIDSVTVNVNPPITASATQTSFTICNGGSDTLGVTAVGGNGTYSYSWSPATGLSSSTSPNPVANPATTTNYTVTVTDNCGTPGDTVVITVNVSSGPVVTAQANITSGCAPLCVDFSGQSSGNCSSVAWDFGDNASSSLQAPTHCYTTPGVYTADFTCTDAGGCTGTGTVTITVVAPPAASASSVSGPVIMATGTSTQICFDDNTSGATSWAWDFNGLGTSTQQSPCFSVADTGGYCATLIVANAAGCADSTEVCVFVVGEMTIMIPNVFTPNSDGNNDVFTITNTGVKSMRCAIYDRWGVMIYEWTSANGGWDGRTTSGLMATDGVYYYTAYLTDYTDKETEHHGFLHLISGK